MLLQDCLFKFSGVILFSPFISLYICTHKLLTLGVSENIFYSGQTGVGIIISSILVFKISYIGKFNC